MTKNNLIANLIVLNFNIITNSYITRAYNKDITIWIYKNVASVRGAYFLKVNLHTTSMSFKDTLILVNKLLKG